MFFNIGWSHFRCNERAGIFSHKFSWGFVTTDATLPEDIMNNYSIWGMALEEPFQLGYIKWVSSKLYRWETRAILKHSHLLSPLLPNEYGIISWAYQLETALARSPPRQTDGFLNPFLKVLLDCKTFADMWGLKFSWLLKHPPQL